MYKNIREVFNDLVPISIDTKLGEKITRYLNNFITKNEDHSLLFGSPLSGCYTLKFTPNDRSIWFEEILQVDESILKKPCAQLIDPNVFAIAGETFNLSCVWLIHRIWKSTKIPDSKKQKYMSDVAMIMNIRFLSSRWNRHWPYVTSKAVAEATLASMSNKYDIKRLGSWMAVLRERSDNTVDMKHSIHRLTFERMDIDLRTNSYSVGYVLTDSQTRIKAMLKNIYNQQKIIQEQGLKINSVNGTFIETDGVSVLRDKELAITTYKNYLNNIIADKPSFIKLDLVSVIEQANKTAPAQVFRNTLSYISEQYGKGREGKLEIDDLIDRILSHLFSTLENNKTIMKNNSDLPGLISRMKGIYGSARSTDETLLSLRVDIERLVTKATKVTNKNVCSAVRNSILLYICLRTLTMRYYS